VSPLHQDGKARTPQRCTQNYQRRIGGLLNLLPNWHNETQITRNLPF